MTRLSHIVNTMAADESALEMKQPWRIWVSASQESELLLEGARASAVMVLT